MSAQVLENYPTGETSRNRIRYWRFPSKIYPTNDGSTPGVIVRDRLNSCEETQGGALFVIKYHLVFAVTCAGLFQRHQFLDAGGTVVAEQYHEWPPHRCYEEGVSTAFFVKDLAFDRVDTARIGQPWQVSMYGCNDRLPGGIGGEPLRLADEYDVVGPTFTKSP